VKTRWYNRLADLKYSNGRLFRIPTGSPHCTKKQYSVGLRAVTIGAIVQGAHADGTAKSCSNPERMLQPFFRKQKAQAPYLQTLVFSLI